MTDKELLELAAKAVGLTLRYNYLGGRDANQPWDPLTDDGDALRLAVRLKMLIEISDWGAMAVTECGAENGDQPEYAYTDGQSVGVTRGDSSAATRRAIVLAAAEIGKAMP